MKKGTLLPLIFLLTFALCLTSTPAAEEWALQKRITRPGGPVYALDFSVGGRRLVVGTSYNDAKWNLQVYDGNTFEYLHGRDYTDPGERDHVSAISSRKGWYEAAAAGRFFKVYLHNTLQNNTVKTFNTRSQLEDLAYSLNGNRLAAAGRTGDIYIFHTDHRNGTRRLLRTLRGHSGVVRTVAWSPSGTFASGGDDGTVRLWNTSNGINYAVLRGHTRSVRAVSFNSGGGELASGSFDGTVRIWDVNTQRLLRTKGGFGTNHIEDIAFHPSQPHTLAVAAINRVDIVNTSTGQRIIQSLGLPNALHIRCYDVDFHSSGKTLAVGAENNSVYIFKLITVNRLDVNKDGTVDINDLIAVARDYGKTGERSTDVNNDNRVDIKDLTEVARAINPNFAAPSVAQEVPHLPFTAQEVQKWIEEAKAQGIDADGIAMLERLLQVVLQQVNLPKETVLLANYPNPFNPETWIPYQLAKPAEVTVSIQSADGTFVRTLELGQLPAGVYQEKDRAVYWDGKNEQGESVASGVYFYTLKAGDFSATRKMLIRK